MHPNDKMKTRSQNTYHIVRRVRKQGTTHPPTVLNQSGVKNYTTELTTSLEKHSDGNQAQRDLPAGPSRITPTKKKEKGKHGQTWSREVYKEVMHAFYIFLEKQAGSHVENTFRIWRSRNHNVRMNLDGNELVNVRRDILN